MKEHNHIACTCNIIPDVMVKRMRKEGYNVPINHENAIFREKRQSIISQKNVTNSGQIFVFDSQNRGKLRLKEVLKSNKDLDVIAAYDNAAIVKQYFKNVLGWDSIDGKALDIICNVHYLKKYNNAFWDGEQMTFGDGDGIMFDGFARSLDVTAHELTHGVVQYLSGLIYKGQSGALNEHFADVFGSAVKQWHLKQEAKNADWLIGDTCMSGNFKGKAIRSMKDPSNAKIVLMAQPDNMYNIYKGKSDNGGVHINSGIPNKAFYFVSMEIGTDKAALIWFEALKLLKPNSKFSDFYKAVCASCELLMKADKVNKNALSSIQDAFLKVGILN